LAAGVLAGGYVFAVTSAPSEAIDLKDAAKQLFAITNLDRTSNGAQALKRDSRLDTISVARSEDMIRRDYFSHQIPPNNTTVADIVESLGLLFGSVGENIAWNNANDFQTVQGAGQDFIESPHHRENLLDPRWDRMGTGVAEGGGKKMYTVVFMQAPLTPARGAPGAVKPSPTPAPAAAPARVQGERVETASTRTGLLTTLVNSVVRLFLQQ
jgi:uncharacterized protein YkwD